MATIQFDLVSPERKLASLEASEIQIPGSDGDFTAMAEHAPVLTTLKPGLLSVKVGNDLMEYIVTGGFVEISGSNASVLAEEALPRNEVDTSVIERCSWFFTRNSSRIWWYYKTWCKIIVCLRSGNCTFGYSNYEKGIWRCILCNGA